MSLAANPLLMDRLISPTTEQAPGTSIEITRRHTSNHAPRSEDHSPDRIAQRTPKVRWRDLPNKDQLFLLAVCRLSEPLSNVCLLPYIFYLVKSVLPKPPSPDVRDGSSVDASTAESEKISEYSGFLVAAFPLAQCLVSLPWGRLSDSYGRKTSILIGLLVSIIANAGFGFSKSFASLVFWRALAGLANGNVGIMRTVTAEIVRERRYQTKAFLLLPLVFNSGMVISLALGGALAEPAKNLPSLFGPGGLLNLSGGPNGVEWLLAYPFALPALMNAFVLGVALILATLFLRETLPGMESAVDPGLRLGSALHRLVLKILGQRDHGAYTEVKDEESLSEPSSAIEQPEAKLPPDEQGPKPPQLPFRKIWTRNVLASTVAFGLLPLHNAAFMHIFPIFLSTPSADNSHATLVAFAGGLGLTSSTIGLWLSAFGTVGILLQLFIYPRLQSRIGTLGVFRIALLLFPAVYAVAPYLSLLPPNGILRWLGLGVVICGQIAARTMAIPSTVILLTEAAPAKTVLGTVHGAGNMIASLARAIGPAVGGVVFGWGVHAGIIGMVWWLYLVCVSLLALIWTIWMQQPDG